jgi:GntR family transcriptional regulator, transcriptional repressor for pyruvate dehydrogenase complex
MSNNFVKIQPRSLLSKTVEAQIEEAILSKSIQQGEKLPTEFELCEQFGVSRTVIRDALKLLSARGLVEVTKRKGIFVKNLTPDDVSDPLFLYLHQLDEKNASLNVVKARQIIEPPIAHAAALYHTEEDVIRLQKAHQDLIEYEGDYEKLSHLDMVFHLNIARASENVIIPLLLEPIFRLMPQIKKRIYENVSDAKESAVKLHSEILDAIFRKDAKAAYDAMVEHLKIAEEHAIKSSENDKNSSPNL